MGEGKDGGAIQQDSFIPTETLEYWDTLMMDRGASIAIRLFARADIYDNGGRNRLCCACFRLFIKP